MIHTVSVSRACMSLCYVTSHTAQVLTDQTYHAAFATVRGADELSLPLACMHFKRRLCHVLELRNSRNYRTQACASSLLSHHLQSHFSFSARAEVYRMQQSVTG